MRKTKAKTKAMTTAKAKTTTKAKTKTMIKTVRRILFVDQLLLFSVPVVYVLVVAVFNVHGKTCVALLMSLVICRGLLLMVHVQIRLIEF